VATYFYNPGNPNRPRIDDHSLSSEDTYIAIM